MGKAKEQEVRLMGLGFVAVAIVASLLLILVAVKIGGDLRSHSPAGVGTPDGAPLGLEAVRAR
jgi:hypothetical protein